MNKFTRFIKEFIEDESGLTAVEYAIAGGLVVGGMVGAFATLGDNATGQINTLGCAASGGSEATQAEVDADATNNTNLGDCLTD